MLRNGDSDLVSCERCLPYRVGRLLAGISPRGKGFIPRLIGRLARPWIDHVFVTRHGGLIPLLPDALDIFVAMSRQGNSYDYWVFRVANAMLEEQGVFYDVGANVGYLSVEVANLRARDRVYVYAFEPNPQLAGNIAKAIELNRFDNLDVAQAALGDLAGKLGFTERPNSLISSVTRDGEEADYRVPVMSIDQLVLEKGFRPPDVIKIDVEGFECAVLEGSRRVLVEQQPAVVFEISPGTLRYGYSPGMIVNLLEKAGYDRFYTVKCKLLSRRDIADLEGKQGDIVAIPPRRRGRLDWFAAELRAGRIDSYWEK